MYTPWFNRILPTSFILAGILILALTVSAQALMPPHVSSTEPPQDGVLKGNVFILHGYTLYSFDQDSFAVSDHAGNEVPFSLEKECRTEGEGTAPGSQQNACTFWLTLEGLEMGKQYQVEFLYTEEVFRFTTAD